MKKKEEEKNKEDNKEDNKEGFIGTNTDKNRDPKTRAINALIAAIKSISFCITIFIYTSSSLDCINRIQRKSRVTVVIKFLEQIHLNHLMLKRLLRV